MTQARMAAFAANAAAREVMGAAKLAALAAGQAAAVGHVAAHELGAAAYAIRAARVAAPEGKGEEGGRMECQWQRAQLPSEIRELVLDDQKLRNEICWFVFAGLYLIADQATHQHAASAQYCVQPTAARAAADGYL